MIQVHIHLKKNTTIKNMEGTRGTLKYVESTEKVHYLWEKKERSGCAK